MKDKYTVKIDPQAKQDLKDIFIYVALNNNLESAEIFLASLEKTCQRLEKIPERGHTPKELLSTGIKRYLEISSKPYRIIYEISSNTIYIHSVLDGRRNIQEILSERILK
ncbi:MAG: type II toxin-antitoxin system RelE/ParE family toxin [Ignavibacteriae bacterium]|nr:type II toxin-antitoxin system RelE/ParE family toxin [Ignavibacteriota bacterium]